MKRIRVGLLFLTLSGCVNFDREYNKLCSAIELKKANNIWIDLKVQKIEQTYLPVYLNGKHCYVALW